MAYNIFFLSKIHNFLLETLPRMWSNRAYIKILLFKLCVNVQTECKVNLFYTHNV